MISNLRTSSIGIVFLMICLFWYGCSDEFKFDSSSILGRYEGNLLFMWPDQTDTLLVVPCRYDFNEDGTVVFTQISTSKRDTSNWFLNESARKLTIQSDFFLGTSINDIIKYDRDSLIFEGLTWVNVTGLSNQHLRKAVLVRLD